MSIPAISSISSTLPVHKRKIDDSVDAPPEKRNKTASSSTASSASSSSIEENLKVDDGDTTRRINCLSSSSLSNTNSAANEENSKVDDATLKAFYSTLKATTNIWHMHSRSLLNSLKPLIRTLMDNPIGYENRMAIATLLQ